MSTIIKNPLTLFTPATKVVGTDLVVSAEEVEVVEEEEEEVVENYFYCKLYGGSTLYAFEIDNSNYSWAFYDGVFDITNSVSIYISSGSVDPLVYLTVGGINYLSNPELSAGQIPQIGTTYVFGSYAGGSN